MSTAFADHFSAVAPAYARYRPSYPAELFAEIARHAPHRRRAWDCGCGNGQAARALAGHFDQVVASDPSAAQLAATEPHARVRYRRERAEASSLAPESVDLVAVAQALHWFELESFYAEVNRVLVPAGIIAAWSYGRIELPSVALATIIDEFRDGTLAPYWPPERALVESGYRQLAFPFDAIAAAPLAIELDWSMGDLLGYFDTWSSIQRYRAALGDDPLPRFAENLAAHWGEPSARHRLRWPIALRLGRKRGV